MSIKDLLLKSKGIWLVTLSNGSKWVLNLSEMTFDNYEWYKAMGTTESELTNIDDFIKGNWKRLK